MSYRGLEEAHLTYYKLMDGLGIKSGGKVCDSSFNDFVTAKYLAEQKLFETVYALTANRVIVQEGIEPVRSTDDCPDHKAVSHGCTYMSGGTFNFIPVHDVTHAIHSSLNAGGMIYIAVYPNIYDSQGRDVLMMLSQRAQIPVKDKLNRWAVTVINSITNMFANLKQEEVITDSSISEVISLFSEEQYKKQLFKTGKEFEQFFQPLSAEQKYYMSWNVLKGMRI